MDLVERVVLLRDPVIVSFCLPWLLPIAGDGLPHSCSKSDRTKEESDISNCVGEKGKVQKRNGQGGQTKIVWVTQHVEKHVQENL